MAALFLLSGRGPQHAPGQKLIKAPEASALLNAVELGERMAAEELEAKARAREAFEKAKEDGYQAGLEAGREEHALKIMDTAMASVEYLERLEGDLARIVEEAVRKIIGAIPDGQLIVSLVRKALSTMRDDRRVVVKVSPEDEPAVREALLGAAQGSAFLDVRPDGRLQKGNCLLESELGVVEGSVEAQLKSLSAALQSRVKAGG